MAGELKHKKVSVTTIRDQYLIFATLPAPLFLGNSDFFAHLYTSAYAIDKIISVYKNLLV
jgi:hypothetical protein